MLRIKDVHKEYRTGSLVQKALDGVSLDLRDNEFVAILGPSGSGKTTLLNIIGGLDRYDSGDLIINGISTRKYKDRDWDAYRNHTIGFVFQSYNLIPHQSVLANVELALTISGVSGKEKRERAVEALTRVGLGDQLHKKPNQMSGGQMQRVAIARALVNNPSVLLADEPTGALDSETSVAIMELLKEVARDRLVVMVTHNPELADLYANRIVRLKDGRILSDSNPYTTDEEEPVHKKMGRASMSFLTALALSFTNLLTKKTRTLLVSFAGSIGIIGIALILSLSNGVDVYIHQVEEDTLSEYPLTITSSATDFSALLESAGQEKSDAEVTERKMVTALLQQISNNDLASLKTFFEQDEEIASYARTIAYDYDVTPYIYRLENSSYRQLSPRSGNMRMGMMSFGGNLFSILPKEESLYIDHYEVKAGHWPTNINEAVLVVTASGYISDMQLYNLGLKDARELDRMMQAYQANENIEVDESVSTYTYADFVGISFRLADSTKFYVYDEEYGVYRDKSKDEDYVLSLLKKSPEITITGVVQLRDDEDSGMLSSGVQLYSGITDYLIDTAADAQIVQRQLKTRDINVITNEPFIQEEEKEKEEMDLNSLFTIDEEALQSAFVIPDMNSFSFDMSAMPGMPNLDISTLFQNIRAEDMTVLLQDLSAGFTDYAKQDPSSDITDLFPALTDYFRLEETRSLVSSSLVQIINDSGMVTVTSDAMQTLVSEILADYEAYVSENPDLENPIEAYLNSERGQASLQASAQHLTETLRADIHIDEEQVSALTDTLLNGYQGYAEENARPQLNRIGEALMSYLDTEPARARIADAIHLEDITRQITGIFTGMMGSYANAITSGISQLMSGFSINPEALQNAFKMNMNATELQELMTSMMSNDASATYESNMKLFNYADRDKPDSISIFPFDFEAKENIVRLLDEYNERMQEEDEDKVITYTDMVGTLMSNITDIINTISYVLIAFVAISLVVSSIMIGIITYISVLERRKEIGILRAIGASKRNVSQVFNAETFIVGLLAGLIGIGITELLLIPANQIIHAVAESDAVSAALPPGAAAVLILLSIVLTLIGGIIPSRAAARSDPVAALRSE